MKIKIIFFSFFLCFFSCQNNGEKICIGYDPSWYPKDFKELQSNVNGYIKEILLEISGKKDVRFTLVKENFDSLFKVLEDEKVEAVLSFKNPYQFLKDKYSFSLPILNIGHVLVVRKESSYTSLDDMKKKLVGIIRGESSILFLEKYEDIFIKIYDSIPELLNDVSNGFLDGAMVYGLEAGNFVRNLYDDLKITGYLTDEAIRLVSLKKNEAIINKFNKIVEELEKEEIILQIKKKWSLF
ncbi:MAG: hypothetical protein AMS24_00120 [Chlamydiae bacterium SM23_39]|nr:MAG: hypothetical protein AMS24_00120 [Chlamydiae bacterium SM23_39]